METTQKCPHCQSEINILAKVCPHCTKRLESQARFTGGVIILVTCLFVVPIAIFFTGTWKLALIALIISGIIGMYLRRK